MTARAVRRWVAGVDPDGTLEDAADVRRSLSMTPGLDGLVFLRGHLDPVGGELLHTALAALMNGDRPAGDARGHNERQGDALMALARRVLDAGSLPEVRGERPHLRVSIDLQALCAERGAAGGTGPDGLPLDVGRAQRTATAAIRRAVDARHCEVIDPWHPAAATAVVTGSR
jgi:hypothetical protein